MLIEFYGWAASGKSTMAEHISSTLLQNEKNLTRSKTSYAALFRFLILNRTFVYNSCKMFFHYRKKGYLVGNKDLLLRLFDWLLQSQKTIDCLQSSKMYYTDHGLMMPLSRIGKRSGEISHMRELFDIFNNLIDSTNINLSQKQYTVVFLNTGAKTIKRRAGNRMKNNISITRRNVGKKSNSDFNRIIELHNKNTTELLEYIKDNLPCFQYIVLDNDRDELKQINTNIVLSEIVHYVEKK